MMDEKYGGESAFDRNEMFAIGAAAGALIATAVQEMLERRRKTQTPLERARERATGLVEETGSYARDLTGTASEYLSDLTKQGRKKRKRAQKAMRKRTSQATGQVDMLKDAAATALGAVSVSGVVDRVKGRSDHGWLNGKSAKQGRGWFRSASETAQEYAESAREAVADVMPRKRSRGWWQTAAGTAQEYAQSAKGAVSRGNGRASGKPSSTGGFLETLSTSIADYLESARETVSDADLRTKARGATEAARERIQDASVGARGYASTAGETLREAAGAARERIEDAHLGDRVRDYASVTGETVKDYGAKAGKVAKVSATRLGTGVETVAESAAESAKDLRKGVKKRVKKTRRRINWGLRAFLVGLAVGVLAAPQSGQRTREALQSFLEGVLDIILGDEQGGQGVAR